MKDNPEETGNQENLKNATTSGGSSHKKFRLIYLALSVILLILIGLIILKINGNGGLPREIHELNNLDKGFQKCKQAVDFFGNDQGNACDALKILEEGIALVESELNKLRDSNADLPQKYGGYDSKFATLLGFRKTLREQCYIANAKKERSPEKEIKPEKVEQ